MAGMARVRNAHLLVSIALLLLVSAYFARGVVSTYQAGYFDLSIFQQAVMRYERGEMIYERSDHLEDRYKPGAIVFKFPPPYLLHFFPWSDANGVTQNERIVLTGCYVALQFLLIALACWLLWWMASSTALLPLLAAYSLCFIPYFIVQGGTSAEGYIAAISLLAFTLMRRYPLIAGVLFAWLGCIKLYPFFLLLYPLLTRQWRVLLGAGMGSLGIVCLSLLIFSGEDLHFYFYDVLPVLLAEPVSEDWTTVFRHTTGNQSIVKVLVDYELLPNRLPFWLNTVRLPFVIGLLVLCLHRCIVHDERQERALLAFSLTVVTMLICLPNIFYGYFIVLLFPIWVIALGFYTRRQWAMLAVLLVVASVFLVNDNWTYMLAEQAGFFNPDALPAHVIKEAQRLGVEAFLFRYHTTLALLWNYTKLSPFVPYILWLMLAFLLWSSSNQPLINRAQTPA